MSSSAASAFIDSIPATGVGLVAVGLVLLFLLAAALVAFFVHRRLIFRRSSASIVLVAVFLSWWLPFSIVFLLPFDIASTNYRTCLTSTNVTTSTSPSSCIAPFVYIPAVPQRILWQVIYWTIFAISWIAIPILQSYVDGGGFNALQRLKEALYLRVRFLAVIVWLGIVFIVYLLISRTPLDFMKFKALAMALSNAYGLILVVLFLGYGLVSIPRTLWHKADTQRCLIFMELTAPKTKEAYENSILELENVHKEIYAAADQVVPDHPLRVHVDHLLGKCPPRLPVASSGVQILGGGLAGIFSRNSQTTETMTLAKLQNLNERQKAARLDRDRWEYRWNNLVSGSFLAQRILECKGRGERTFQVTSPRPTAACNSLRLQRVRWAWLVVLRPLLCRFAGVAAGTASAVLVWSECSMNIGLSVFAVLPKEWYTGIQVLCLCTIAYMAYCAFVPLLSLRVFSFYQLAPHNTSVTSLLFFAGFLTRLSFPLCWNVLNLSKSDAVFSTVMGSVNLVPLLGERFNAWLPITLVALCLLTLFNVHSRILRILNINSGSFLAADDDDCNADRADGRILLREGQERQSLAANQERLLNESAIQSPASTSVSTTPLVTTAAAAAVGGPELIRQWMVVEDEVNFMPLGKRRLGPVPSAANLSRLTKLAPAANL